MNCGSRDLHRKRSAVRTVVHQHARTHARAHAHAQTWRPLFHRYAPPSGCAARSRSPITAAGPGRGRAGRRVSGDTSTSPPRGESAPSGRGSVSGVNAAAAAAPLSFFRSGGSVSPGGGRFTVRGSEGGFNRRTARFFRITRRGSSGRTASVRRAAQCELPLLIITVGVKITESE